jgi:hypothetical protein
MGPLDGTVFDVSTVEMRRRVRRIRSVMATGVTLVIVGFLGAALLPDYAVRVAAEQAGKKVLNVPVTVGKAEAALLGGSFGLRNMRVANPAGYVGPSLLTLARADATAETGSLLSRQVHIKDLKLRGMEVFIEQKGARNNLYEVIQPLREPHAPTGKRLLVDNLEITDVIVHVGLSALPAQTPAAHFTLAPIRMTDLGRDEDIDTGVLIMKIVLAIAAGVAKQSGDLLPADNVSAISSLLDKALDLGRIILGPKSGAPKTGGDPGPSLPDGLKNLLGGGKKQ